MFGAAATLAGIVATFLPAALPHATAGLVAAALLVQSVAATVTRWCAGKAGDRIGPRRLLGPALLVTAAGLAALPFAGRPAAALDAAAVFGAGFGALQAASLTVMLDSVPQSRYGTVTALWSVAYDAGLGIGAAGFGLLASATGYRTGLLVTAVLAAATVISLRRRPGSASRPGPARGEREPAA
ncbi:MFS transporter [Dactylosporangium sp. CA-139066]|uniref:MFS transporter n=1 Tax=Dactylosporangium sp. CA-139066 TaxID=3239930 RepID=UPI003D903D5C